jgi:murein DD-endopeptidase MepM/ murein hydrolase activator NlpD
LKRFIPGYTDQAMKYNAYRSALMADSLQQALSDRDIYITNLGRVLRGEAPADSTNLFRSVNAPPTASDLASGLEDSLMRERVRSEAAYDLDGAVGATAKDQGLTGLFFFPPIRGVVTGDYERTGGHFGIDIVTKKDEAVKSTLDGTVVLASWTSDGGHVLQVQHRNDLVSVYKHNSVLLKKVGDKVKAGEAIAIVGDSGELTTGPHLHFELWLKGEPIDPQAYMVFK